jgi:hypothetical protein
VPATLYTLNVSPMAEKSRVTPSILASHWLGRVFWPALALYLTTPMLIGKSQALS